jgi:tripartite-type tricarboxylate transporter receptor subunit TctC
MKRSRWCASLVLLSSAVFNAAPVAAQAFPHKPVRVIIPYGPGGGSDIILRPIVPKLSEQFRQSVVIDNRPGGSSTIGTGLVARSAPDGYTLLLVDSAILVNPSLFAKLPYDTLNDFAPVIFAASSASILLVHPAVPARSVKELVALAKQRPGQLTYASAGFGTGGHMASEMLKLAAGIDMLHVPYKGAGPAMTDALGGHVTMIFTTAGAAKGPIGAGQMIGLALTGDRRIDSVSQVPTFAEAGYPDVNASITWGVFAPAGTPKEIVGRVNAAFNQTLQAPESRLRLADLGFVAGGGTPEAWAAEVRASIARWAQVVKRANIKTE